MDGKGQNGQKTQEQPPEQSAAAAQRGFDIGKVLEARKGEHHAVVIQDYPDPDAISAAYAHRLISSAFDIRVDILYSERISHPQNLALVRLLEIPLLHYDPEIDFKQYNCSIFVDNQGTTAREITEALEKAGVPVLLVVDHHELQERLKPEFADIRHTGATATIYAEYLKNGPVHMDKSHREHMVAATALLHGIMTDTGDFVRAGPKDLEAAAFLSQFRDADIYGQIINQARTRQTMEVIYRALGNRTITESYSIAGIGYLRADDRDAILQAADFLLTEENVHTAIVYGIVTGSNQEGKLVGSMRTSKITIDPDDFIKQVFGKNAAGGYFGGGKMSAGGFEIPIGFLSGDNNEEYRQMKWKVYDAQIKQKIFAKIGIEVKPAG